MESLRRGSRITGWRRTVGIVTALAVVLAATPHVACAESVDAMPEVHAMHEMGGSSLAADPEPASTSSTGCDDPAMNDHCLQHCAALAIPPVAVASVAAVPPGARVLSVVAHLIGIPTPADSPPPKG